MYQSLAQISTRSMRLVYSDAYFTFSLEHTINVLDAKSTKLSFFSYLHHLQFSSVQFSHSVVSDSLWPHESQHARPPCPSQTPKVYSNTCPSSRWCHPAISSSVVPLSSCPQSLPATGSFPMSQLFAWGAKVLKFKLQHQSLQWTPRTDLL